MKFKTDFKKPIELFYLVSGYPYSWIYAGENDDNLCYMFEKKFPINFLFDDFHQNKHTFYSGWNDGYKTGNGYCLTVFQPNGFLTPLGVIGSIIMSDRVEFAAFGQNFVLALFGADVMKIKTPYYSPIYLDEPLAEF